MAQISRFAGRLLMVVVLGIASAFADDSGSNISEPPGTPALDQARQEIRKGNWTAALNSLNSALRDDPRNADVHNLMGYSYRKQAKPNLSKAFEHYRLAIQLDPNHRGAHEYLGEACLLDKNLSEAKRLLARLESICGSRVCDEYLDLKKAIDAYTDR